MNISNLSDIIRWPILMLGKILDLIFKYAVELGIVILTFFTIRWIIKSGIIGRIVMFIESRKNKKEVIINGI